MFAKTRFPQLGESSLVGGATTLAGALLWTRQAVARESAAERLAAAAMEALLNAVDANDPETGAHMRRVASYALTLADAAEVGEDEMRLVEQVSLFHDIGKIHEALFDIIHVNRRLTPTEKRAIDTHPRRGADVLQPLHAFYPQLRDGVLSHHERWDGRGYPRQLRARRIPLASRIVTIADTFDAITYTRRYHTGRSALEAREVILEGRGAQFDPELVDLFVFPPVFSRILETERRVSKWRGPVKKRDRGDREKHVPDITFRWRPESRTRGPRK
jgi:HD-GYP domain-containing protein (c-di-GMP phosphodiesterase class II)